MYMFICKILLDCEVTNFYLNPDFLNQTWSNLLASASANNTLLAGWGFSNLL